jgi:hypothetical protein
MTIATSSNGRCSWRLYRNAAMTGQAPGGGVARARQAGDARPRLAVRPKPNGNPIVPPNKTLIQKTWFALMTIEKTQLAERATHHGNRPLR